MKRFTSIRSKVLVAVVLFILASFGFVEYWHTSFVKRQFLRSEEARNTLLIETVTPVLGVNMAFGLDGANDSYLKSVISKNSNIISIVLKDVDGRRIYAYGNNDIGKNSGTLISRTINDDATGTVLGSVEIRFSNSYYEELVSRHEQFTRRFFVVMVLMLVVLIWLLNRAFLPMVNLIKNVRLFDPRKDGFNMKRTRRTDEVGVVQNALVDMIERIRDYTNRLDSMTDTLELKVKERTEQLKHKTEKLEKSNSALAEKINKIKEQENLLIAQSRLAAMGEMMSMVAHQWRQPLATTTLMITDYNIKSMLSGKQKDERDEIMQKISDIMIYLSDTVDDFQTYFKPENKLEKANLNEIVRRGVNFIKPRLERFGIELVYTGDKNVWVETYVNELVQVIINICNNAIDAIVEAESGKKTITIEISEDKDCKKLSISDTGGGMSKEVMDRAFEPYFSTKGKNGTGLGF
ncbi:MAG: hypothetical protein B5M52_06615 [Helicobacteraceae bacterium 4484_230]|nr:MAG: hypothetical protein B5M52_06615 [Helicobacteraceae bacterium 4484_230]